MDAVTMDPPGQQQDRCYNFTDFEKALDSVWQEGGMTCDENI